MKENYELFKRVVQDQIGGYSFENEALLQQAFTRKSFSKENGGEDNEVLEFIGDKVLDIAVVRYLARRYGTDLHAYKLIPEKFHPKKENQEFKSELSEGELTKLKQKMVQKRSLARRIDELELARFLRTGEGDKRKDVAQNESVKEDLFEAIIGAVALDSDWDFDRIQNVVETMLNPDAFVTDTDDKDYVSLVYEWDNQRNGLNPQFKYFDRGESKGLYGENPSYDYARYQPSGIREDIPGLVIWNPKMDTTSPAQERMPVGPVGLVSRKPDEGMTSIISEGMRVGPMELGRQSIGAGMSVIMPEVIHGHVGGNYSLNHYNKACQIKLSMDLPSFEDYGITNNQARQAACKLAYEYLEKWGLLFTIKDEIEDPNIEDAINQLETLSRRGYFSLPEYDYNESHDEDGNPVWKVKCHIEEYKYVSCGEASSKKLAKKTAAYNMLMHVLKNDKS